MVAASLKLLKHCFKYSINLVYTSNCFCPGCNRIFAGFYFFFILNFPKFAKS